MDNSSFAIGVGIGVILGFALGVSVVIMLKKPEIPNANVIKEAGIVYSYDERNRLQSITPIEK